MIVPKVIFIFGLVGFFSFAHGGVCPAYPKSIRLPTTTSEKPVVISESPISVKVTEPDGPASFNLQMRNMGRKYLELVAVLDDTLYTANRNESKFGLNTQNITFRTDGTIPSIETMMKEEHSLLVRVRTEEGLSFQATIPNILDFEYQSKGVLKKQKPIIIVVIIICALIGISIIIFITVSLIKRNKSRYLPWPEELIDSQRNKGLTESNEPDVERPSGIQASYYEPMDIRRDSYGRGKIAIASEK